ncbi:hypothetical protein Trydic_g18810 [Trypoxylus dichotomus]
MVRHLVVEIQKFSEQEKDFALNVQTTSDGKLCNRYDMVMRWRVGDSGCTMQPHLTIKLQEARTAAENLYNELLEFTSLCDNMVFGSEPILQGMRWCDEMVYKIFLDKASVKITSSELQIRNTSITLSKVDVSPEPFKIT